jgi:spermidine/putrescine transport system substrate-binding protein
MNFSGIHSFIRSCRFLPRVSVFDQPQAAMLYRGWGLAIIAVFMLLITGACSQEKDMGPDTQKEPPSVRAKVVNLYNWEEYIDQSILDEFEKETGIKVNLKVFNSSEETVAGVQANPLDHDLFCIDGTTRNFFIKNRIVRPLDISKLANAKNVPDELKEQLKYGVPYLSGTTGFVINTKHIPSNTKSVKILWDPKYKGKGVLLNEPRDAMGCVLAYSGFSINCKNPEELKIAERNAVLLKKNGISFGANSQENLEKVISGEKWIGQVFSDNAGIARIEEKGLKYILPREGFTKWGDTFAMHMNAPNAENAYKFLDFILRPEIAARCANLQYGQTRILGAKKYLDKKLLSNSIVYPSDEDLKNGEAKKEVGPAMSEYMRILHMLKI